MDTPYPGPGNGNKRAAAAITSSLELMQEIHHRLPDVEIRDEQIDALDAIEENEQAGNPSSLIVLPPGLGKTVIMAADTRRRLLRDPAARGAFLNDKNDILNQSRDRFEKIVGEEFTYGLFSGDGRDYDELSVLFGSFQVMREWRYAFLKDEFKFGVVDESHHGMAPTYKPTLDYFDFEHLLGATATPDRLDIKDIRDIFGPEIYSMTLEVAIARRLLAAVDYHVISDEITETGVVLDDDGHRYDANEFNRTIFAPRRDEEIADIAKRYALRLKNPTTMGFCKSIEHAEKFSGLFENAAALHCDLKRPKQRELLDRFRSGDLKALFTVNMLDEGIDIPEANQVLFLSATGSKRKYLQELGRGLRRTKTKKRVQVLDFVNNAERLLLVDRMWRDAAIIAGGDDPADKEIFDINISKIHFDESSRSALQILRAINGRVYRADQAVPAESLRASGLAKELGMSKPALLALAASLKIAPSVFPTQRGSRVPYFVSDDVERLRLARDHLFQ